MKEIEPNFTKTGSIAKRGVSFKGVPVVSNVFIETGTGSGGSIWDALAMGFDKIYSSDVWQKGFEIASICFKKNPMIQLFNCSSPEFLPKVIDPSQSTTFFLDAHYTGIPGNSSFDSKGQCPLLDELKIIFSYNWKTLPLIIVDDAYYFRDVEKLRQKEEPIDGFDWEQFPTIAEIKKKMPAGWLLEILDDEIYIYHPDWLGRTVSVPSQQEIWDKLDKQSHAWLAYLRENRNVFRPKWVLTTIYLNIDAKRPVRKR